MSSRPLLFLLVAFAVGPAHAEWYRDAREKMTTKVEILLWHEDAAEARRLIEAGMAEMDRIDAAMSTYRPETPISRVNREAAMGPVAVSRELYDLVARSAELSRRSDGAFDITFDSVGQLYDFRGRRRPDDAAIAKALPEINYRHVVLGNPELTIRFTVPGTRINLGGIAKGYICERVTDILRQAGVLHAMVTAGGDTRLLGDRRGKPWMVGVQHPDRSNRWVTRLPLKDEAISTSGDYERFFDEDGVRYHHILDPASGKSARGLRSVSIIGPDATLTDGLSTAVFVMGAARGMALVEDTPGYDAVLISAEGHVTYSRGLQAR
jgi:FAD:protein FMN transferase